MCLAAESGATFIGSRERVGGFLIDIGDVGGRGFEDRAEKRKAG